MKAMPTLVSVLSVAVMAGMTAASAALLTYYVPAPMAPTAQEPVVTVLPRVEVTQAREGVAAEAQQAAVRAPQPA